MCEDQESITAWAEATFGEQPFPLVVATRCNEEMAELLNALAAASFRTDWRHRAASECADVFIVLVQVAESLGVDLMTEVDRKMDINRNRDWKVGPGGTGQHK